MEKYKEEKIRGKNNEGEIKKKDCEKKELNEPIKSKIKVNRLLSLFTQSASQWN